MVDEPTWIVLIRDVSHAVRIDGEACVVASLVLDADTGLVGEGPLPEVTEVVSDEAENIFDSFVGHMTGRIQPEEFATSDDWAMLVDHADAYRRAEPWRRWTDQDHLDLVIRIDGTPTRYLTIVIGAEGVQHGLILYPSGTLPETLGGWQPGAKSTVPAGAILFYLDPPDEAPQEFIAKAARYGWPTDADLTPVWLTTGQQGPADLDRTAVQRLTVAIAAVLAHGRQPDLSGPTSGTCALAPDRQGAYTARRIDTADRR